ncbi:LacI family DNA-binding transcriptional regulator, partial [Streptococcus pneumoniae]
MVTIKDIARVSGVSHGTVSNVLNKKGNVSAA